jgi:AcrR family transcriptional regulator
MGHVEDKRQAILDATLKLVAEHGFHGTAMSKIAQGAGVSTGSIYNYFDGKDELIDQLYKSVRRRSARAILENLDHTQPEKTQIRHILRNVISHAIDHPQESAFVMQYMPSPFYHPGIDAELSQDYQPLHACFERARRERIIKDLPQDVLNVLTVDVATSLAQRQAGGQLTLTSKLVEQVINTSWEAISH